MSDATKLPGTYEDGEVSRFSMNRYTPGHNLLMAHANKNRLGPGIVSDVEILGDTQILGGTGMAPMTNPLLRRFNRPAGSGDMVRLMGQTTIDQRRWGSRSLWEGTPIAKVIPPSVGEPFDQTFDVSEVLAGVESLGWEWDFKSDLLKAYVRTSRGMTTVTIPGAKIKAIMLKAFELAYGVLAPKRFRKQATCGDLFSDIGNFFTKEIPKAVDNVAKGIDSFVKDPGKWIENAGKDIAKVAESVVNDVISSEVFAGVMGAVAVIPPLQAVGGAGLAAYGVAKTAKTVIGAVKAGEQVVRGIAGSGSGSSSKGASKPKYPRALTKDEARKIADSKEFKIWANSPGIAAMLRAPKGSPLAKQAERAMVDALYSFAEKQGLFKKAAPKPAPKVVAKVGPKQIPVKVKATPKKPEQKPASVKAEKAQAAFSDLQLKVAQLEKSKEPFAQLLLSSLKSVSV